MTSPFRHIDVLREQFATRLAPLLNGAESVALLDFPNHSNVGDSAIWLGELAWLRAQAIAIRYASDRRTYCSEALRRQLPKGGVVLLHGGGNLGDLWPSYQDFREHVLNDLQEYRIIQLPQSIHFDRLDALKRAERVFGGHPDFHLLVRDRRSLEIGIRGLGVPTSMCPDMALFLDDLPQRGQAEVDVLVLARTDHESANPPMSGNLPNVKVLDWLERAPNWAHRSGPLSIVPRLGRKAARHAKGSRTLQSRGIWQSAVIDMYERRSRRQLIRGCDILSRGRVVITDRLHAHILCLLMGMRHVVVDNSYGKVHGFMAAWGTDVAGVERSADFSTALERARDLI